MIYGRFSIFCLLERLGLVLFFFVDRCVRQAWSVSAPGSKRLDIYFVSVYWFFNVPYLHSFFFFFFFFSRWETR